MTAGTALRPSLREVVLDALDIAFWEAQGEIQGCVTCGKNPAGVCAHPDHQGANAAARDFEEARKQIEQSPGDAEVLAVLGSMNGGMDHDDAN